MRGGVVVPTTDAAGTRHRRDVGDVGPGLGRAALWWSYLYFGAMVVRYVVRMTRRPDQRWLGGTIPIIFHSFVAAFQWLFGMYHVALR
jgi:hypothetical protein